MIRRPLAARRVLVVAPHPDDEAIGAWALMRQLGRRGARVEVMVVTDGAGSHPGSCSWPPARLAVERRRETLRAMATLAIPPSRIRFLALPDGGLETCSIRLMHAVGRALRQRAVPDLMIGPVADDAHADHRAVAAALARIPRRGERRLGYRVWPERAGRSGRGLRIALDSRSLCLKRRLVRSYRTQGGMIADAEAGFAMTARHIRCFVRPHEHFEVMA